MKWIYNDGGRSKYFKADNVSDCAVRAIAIATNKDYKDVYDDLKKLNKGVSCRNGTPKNVDKTYLKKLGWVWHSTCKVGKGVSCHLTAEELPSGTLIVQIPKHLVCVKDGVIYDTYDCSIKQYYDRDGNLVTNDYRAVYGYWTKPKGETMSKIDINIATFMAHLGYGTAVTLVDSETAEVVYDTDNFSCPWGTRKEYFEATVESFTVKNNELIVWIKKK